MIRPLGRSASNLSPRLALAVALVAGVVSPSAPGLGGRVVDRATGLPIDGATIVVLAQTPGAGGEPACSPAEIEVATDAAGDPLVARAGTAREAEVAAFEGCSPP